MTPRGGGNWAKVGDRLSFWPTHLPRRVFPVRGRVEKVYDQAAVPSPPTNFSSDWSAAHPFRGVEGANGEWDYDVPMLPGDHVTDEAGTGFVHTAPSHGADDYQLGLKFGLPMTHNVEPDGSFRKDLPLFGGEAIINPDGKEGPANVSVIENLAWAGALFARGQAQAQLSA